MRSCAELRRVRRDLLIQRMLPGLACIGGLFGVSVPLAVATYDIDDEWRDFTAAQPVPSSPPDRVPPREIRGPR